ncbi:MAG TPA: FAD-binding oxidoreductase [Candidatus Desulfovibrio intestinipullorum]|uniref:FAD-binding oxidoreductase n=1 Tax=Candidatus Desulfovibrio intestinipullorum TaxID=2838536 RepID=A0A9D1TQ12_9BACT|nr:FAD-binding oxidoreductase [Candidatus Desulfovibrio intestinipullorum]
MPQKGPHISISPDFVVNRILRINIDDFQAWPESVRELAISIAEELFLAAYNPFINADTVRGSVNAHYERESLSLAHYYATAISEGITMFWSAYEAEVAFRRHLLDELVKILPSEGILSDPAAIVASATDATDLRMELPLMVVEPSTTEQVSALVKLANELKFALIPRGGGSGMTGGAVPARKRTVIVSMTRMDRIFSIDTEALTVTCQAGCITQNVIAAVAKAGNLFSVDPASKLASTIGGNVSENAGGPMAFEYGTTIDNLLWWRMVTPTGEIISVERENHPRHKILPDETAVFVVKDISGGVRNVVNLPGNELRLPGLGKDVTNKALGGLPGVQKEGTDGIITEVCFTTHPKPKFSRVMALEFFGRSMLPAAVVVRELVGLRNRIREEGDYAHISAMEEFNAKYVQAIDYQRKSTKYEGQPISVIIVQVDGDDAYLLDKCVDNIVQVVEKQENVDICVARDKKEAERFWEDRHRLSLIAKRTSGFKINEDVVIPIDRIPEFAQFLEEVNLTCTAKAYRRALQDVGRLSAFPMEDKEFNREFSYISKGALGQLSSSEVSDTEILKRAHDFLQKLQEKYPRLARPITEIAERMEASRLVVASHMHAGDGNCHINMPVNSNDAEMLEHAEEVACEVMAKCQEMGGEVSGEHGIGITKIHFLNPKKMDDLRVFKERTDPRDVMNPAKLVYRDLPVKPFTFSFNSLIRDIAQSGIPDKTKLIDILRNVQTCTRCGKCKMVCPMTCPESSLQYHPRNKNMAYGMLVEAIYYSQINKGRVDEALYRALRNQIEHCTACGRCMAQCPMKIPSGEVAISLHAMIEHEGAGGHPIKEKVLDWLVKDVPQRVPKMAKMASVGQKMQNKFLGLVPASWRKRLQSPMFSGPGPKMGYTNIYESLKVHKGNIFSTSEDKEKTPLVIYFPGCGGGLFYDRIGLSSVMLLLLAGYAVAVPPRHLCCGYPLLAAGMDVDYEDNMAKNRQYLASMIRSVTQQGFRCVHLVTSCPTCLDSLERYNLQEQFPDMSLIDVGQLTFPILNERKQGQMTPLPAGTELIYHGSCHCPWTGVHRIKGHQLLMQQVESYSGAKLILSSGCCGESGMGSVTSPEIYNVLRREKQKNFTELMGSTYKNILLVSCPSCKIGVARCMLNLKRKNHVLHVTEFIAGLIDGEDRRQTFRKKAAETKGEIRIISI